MKKFFCLIVAAVFCVSLCACGVEEQYKPLLEALEANNYEGIKAELSALSEDFAAERNELAKYRQYEALINTIENEDWDGALLEIDKIIPTPPEPVYLMQEITLDNWSTYFELIIQEDWNVNGFGEAEGYSLNYVLRIREEYLEKINKSNLALSVELSYPANYHETTVDLTTREISIGDIQNNVSGSETGDVKTVCDISYVEEDGILGGRYVYTYLIQWDDGGQTMYLIEDMPEVTRIQGTIGIQEE